MINLDTLEKIPTPFIAQVKSEQTLENLFVMVRSAGDGIVRYYDPEKRRWQDSDKQRFSEMWSSKVAFIADASEATGEQDYPRKRLEEKRRNAISYFSRLSLPVLVLIAGCLRYLDTKATGIYPFFFFLSALIGSITSVLLLWYEIDEYNPILQKICSAGKKVNCGAVLQSKASKIAGISWSVIGFAYFVGETFLLLFARIPEPQMFLVLAWLNSLASLYIIYSLYYQWRVARQWCVLCVVVQGLLAIQLGMALAAGWHTVTPARSLFRDDVILAAFFSYLLPFVVVNLLLPLLRSNRDNRQNKAELQRMKHNPQIFDALLKKQKKISTTTEGLGITLGNPQAQYKIVKVCNPYCGPCSQSHFLLENLLDTNPDVQLQIIYLASNSLIDATRIPVKHFLAIAARNEKELIGKVLNDWHVQPEKNYDKFALKYPIDDQLAHQDDKVTAMYDWCMKTDITFTPTVFVNGYQLPPSYSLKDLKYFLSI